MKYKEAVEIKCRKWYFSNAEICISLFHYISVEADCSVPFSKVTQVNRHTIVHVTVATVLHKKGHSIIQISECASFFASICSFN